MHVNSPDQPYRASSYQVSARRDTRTKPPTHRHPHLQPACTCSPFCSHPHRHARIIYGTGHQHCWQQGAKLLWWHALLHWLSCCCCCARVHALLPCRSCFVLPEPLSSEALTAQTRCMLQLPTQSAVWTHFLQECTHAWLVSITPLIVLVHLCVCVCVCQRALAYVRVCLCVST